MKKTSLLAAAMLVAAAAPAFASDQPGAAATQWLEELSGGLNGTTDAGQLLPAANLTRGAGPLTTITGMLINNRDVDLYCVAITSPAAFSATLGADGGGYNCMYLFDSTGHAVTGYLGDGSLGHTIATLPVGSVAAQPAGLYFLAIGRSDFGFGAVDQWPVNAGGANLFNAGFGPVTPNPAIPDALDHWNSNPSPGFGLFNYTYNVTLTGAGYHLVPAPGVCSLLALGGLLAGRRRR